MTTKQPKPQYQQQENSEDENENSTVVTATVEITDIISKRLQGLLKPTVWHEFSPLAVQHNAINLGQGFPNWQTPKFAKGTQSTHTLHTCTHTHTCMYILHLVLVSF